MLLSTDFASEKDLLDRIMDCGIVVEALDRLQIAGIDMRGMHLSVTEVHLFGRGMTLPFRQRYFSRTESH